MGVGSESIDFFLGERLRIGAVSTQRELAVEKHTHLSCEKGTLMKASFESVKFSVRGGRGH
jgi:hypothetical protein